MIKTGMDGCAALIGLHLAVHSSTVELWHRFQKLVTKIVSQARAIVLDCTCLPVCSQKHRLVWAKMVHGTKG